MVGIKDDQIVWVGGWTRGVKEGRKVRGWERGGGEGEGKQSYRIGKPNALKGQPRLRRMGR